MKFYIVGIDDDGQVAFPMEVGRLVLGHQVFSGGRRHYELMKDRLLPDSRWIFIEPPLERVFAEYEKEMEVVVFASGDPLFFGFAGTIKRRMPEADVEVYPYFSSLQMLASRVQMPYEDMRMVSLTGRDWHELDRALIERCEKIGVLTDGVHTPQAVAERMLAYGYSNYRMYVGEHLGGEQERVLIGRMEEAVGKECRMPNCLILEQREERKRPFGIPDDALEHIEGRENMMTKMPVRLLALSLLDLRERRCLWDIGFCTGAVSVEAKLQFPHLRVVGFERCEERRELLEANCRTYGVPGIEVRMGDFTEVNLEGLESPDAVFIGGHGGKLSRMMELLAGRMQRGGVVVFNSVSAESLELFRASAQACGFVEGKACRLTVDAHNPITVVSVYLP